MTSKRRLRPSASAPATSPVTSRAAHPLAWAQALRITDGDARRLTVLDDGAVLVCRPGAEYRH